MNKVVKVILSVLVVLITIACIAGVLFYTGVFDEKDVDNISIYRNTNEQGLVYTEKEWTWTPKEFKGVINYIPKPETPTKNITLNLSPGVYYDIDIPDVPYFYDFGKTVWASDGSFVIRVIGKATQDNLSALAGIDNSESLNQTTVCTKNDAKGVKIIATLVDDVAVIANIYEGDDTYSIIRDSIVNNKGKYEISEIRYAENYSKPDKLSYTGKFVAQYVPQEISLIQERYLFEEGVLYAQSVVEPISSVRETYLKLIQSFSKEDIQVYYNKNGITYAQSGEYTIGLMSYNSNTTIVLIGEGEEARCNIISGLNYIL